MRNAVLLHGLPGKKEYYDSSHPSASNSHWLPWVQKQLLVHDIKADTPEVPLAFEMMWQSWVREVERFEINHDTTLVGHSMGAGFWVRYLSDRPELNVDKVILVAPWLNLNQDKETNFFDFELKPEIVNQTKQFTIFASDNDDASVQNTVDFLAVKLPNVKRVDFHNYGHFCYRDLKTDAFPELLAEII